MASAHAPLVAVVENGQYAGIVSVLALVAHLVR